MCLAQGPQPSNACEAETHGPSVSSQALYHWAIALPNKIMYTDFAWQIRSKEYDYLQTQSILNHLLDRISSLATT